MSNLSILRDQIKNADYPYSFTRGDHTYYWVPIEFIILARRGEVATNPVRASGDLHVPISMTILFYPYLS